MPASASSSRSRSSLGLSMRPAAALLLTRAGARSRYWSEGLAVCMECELWLDGGRVEEVGPRGAAGTR